MTKHARSVTVEKVRSLFDAGMTHDDMLVELNISRPTLQKRLSEGGMRRRAKRGEGSSRTRNLKHDVLAKAASMPAAGHPAIVEGRTLFPGSVTPAGNALNLLVPGVNHAKLGVRVTKGRWRGFPIYALTLEERATCPSSCRHWRSCFGNSMHLAKRIAHGAELEQRLAHEVAILAARHPAGFAVRLHVLGDFYSVEYVELWRQLLQQHPALHVFGFSARWERDDPIAVALVNLVLKRWQRFAIRFSNAPIDECSTVSVEHPGAAPADAIVCPQQIHAKPENCGACALCWHSKRPIAFVQH